MVLTRILSFPIKDMGVPTLLIIIYIAYSKSCDVPNVPNQFCFSPTDPTFVRHCHLGGPWGG